MSCENELLKLAEGLMNSTTGSRYFKDNNKYALQALIRDEGICVYCEKPLWEEYGVASCVDHLIPKNVYAGKLNDVDNLVAACAECNHIKHFYNPSTEGGEGGGQIVITEITEELRLRLISIASDKIKERKATSNWEGEFPNAKRLFKKAVEEYRKCKEILVAA